MPNEDGSFTMYFGYINTNWQEEFDVPIGPDNDIQPGGPDQGQPTHFYPRRSPFLFTIRVPKNFGTQELIWTLRANGRTEKAYASLKTDYEIDKQVISTEVGGDFGSLRDELRYNMPPELEVAGETQRTVQLGEPMTLVALAGDPDNLPPRRDGKPQPRHAGQPIEEADKAQPAASANRGPNPATQANRPPTALVMESGPGLRLSWIVYRGKASAVTFSPEQMKTWTDSRPFANSPWSPPYSIPDPPPDGKWTTQVTFQEPGTYVLRAVASDGSLFTYQNVTVTVTR
ncbi:MAG TPA: hypothetical protein VEV17_20875 [Bryobacteraceae bacterium]|nr:hypothetical protein [Bryobacteraceae bacterium]